MTSHFSSDYLSLKEFGASTFKIRDFVLEDDEHWTAFNPSIAYSPKYGYATTIRSANYLINVETGERASITTSGPPRNQLWFSELDNDLKITNLRQVEFDRSGPTTTRGVEDARLFWKDDSWYFHCVLLEKEHTPKGRIALYRYDVYTNTAFFIKKWESLNYEETEKNWALTPEGNPNFDFIYGPTSIVKDDLIISKPCSDEFLSKIRGGSNLISLGDGSYIAIAHTTEVRVSFTAELTAEGGFKVVPKYFRQYLHLFVRYDNYGNIIETSDEFYFDVLNTEFAAGMVERGDDYVISYGVGDVTAHLAVIPKKNVLELLHPIIDDEFDDWDE
jgi:hypothetical protein